MNFRTTRTNTNSGPIGRLSFVLSITKLLLIGGTIGFAVSEIFKGKKLTGNS